MGYLRKYEWHVDIITKIFIIIILLFICYKIIIYDQRINELNQTIQIEMQNNRGLPVYTGMDVSPAEIAPALQIFTVYITGAVAHPGVYNIDEGSRISDLIALAGGAHDEANLEVLNLAALVEDARHVRIPFLGDEIAFETVSVFADSDSGIIGSITPESGNESAAPAYTGPVNINTANTAGLMSLPGIGGVVAGNIINYRNTHGPFTSLEELMNVSRIGQATFNNIRHLITY